MANITTPSHLLTVTRDRSKLTQIEKIFGHTLITPTPVKYIRKYEENTRDTFQLTQIPDTKSEYP